MYYLTPTSGSTPTTNNVNGTNLTWSPNNSGIMFTWNGVLKKAVSFTSSTATILSSFNGTQLDWRQN
jgi:hypothetical protein